MTSKDVDIDKLLAQRAWHEERRRLRALLLGCGLEEAVKWGKLCYVFEGNTVAIIYAMKDYCAVGFFKGALLRDDAGVLVAPGRHSQAMRQMRFRSLDEIDEQQKLLVACVEQAIQVEKDGLQVAFAEKDNLSYPDELTDALAGDADFAAAFEALTPGRRRGYVIHFSDAKQSATRTSRIDKCRPRILQGKGLNER